MTSQKKITYRKDIKPYIKIQKNRFQALHSLILKRQYLLVFSTPHLRASS